MDELRNLADGLEEAMSEAVDKISKAHKVVSANMDVEPTHDAVDNISTELGLSRLFSLMPMYDTPQEAAAASEDEALQEVTRLEESMAKWIEQSFEGLDK